MCTLTESTRLGSCAATAAAPLGWLSQSPSPQYSTTGQVTCTPASLHLDEVTHLLEAVLLGLLGPVGLPVLVAGGEGEGQEAGGAAAPDSLAEVDQVTVGRAGGEVPHHLEHSTVQPSV